MNGKTVRWLAVSLLAAVALLAWQRYQRDVASVAPAAFNGLASGQSARVAGRVQAGSLQRAAEGASFVLEENGATVPVTYRGSDNDTLRELKTVLVTGRREADGRMAASEVSIAANYGYITAAYGLVIGLLLGVAWRLERAAGKLEKRLGAA